MMEISAFCVQTGVRAETELLGTVDS